MNVDFKIILEIDEEKPVVIIPIINGKSLRRIPLTIDEARKFGNTLVSWTEAAKVLMEHNPT